MKRKVLALTAGMVLSVCVLAGCDAADNELAKNMIELVDEIVPDAPTANNESNAYGQAQGVLHLHDENNEAFCIDVPSDWISPGQTEENGKTVTQLTPGSDPSGDSGLVLVSFGRSSNPDIEGYIERWKDRNLEEHPDCVFAEGTTEVNGYLYISVTYITEDDRLLTDYRILGGNAELRIRQYTDKDNEEQTTEITDITLMMVNSAVLHYPAEETE
ncbi:MAG: hypothetical protein IKO10_07545 [Lachnospiraceae bacterium]|nr:hypothetical protein [Lachnospiraceae bacterium]